MAVQVAGTNNLSTDLANSEFLCAAVKCHPSISIPRSNPVPVVSPGSKTSSSGSWKIRSASNREMTGCAAVGSGDASSDCTESQRVPTPDFYDGSPNCSHEADHSYDGSFSLGSIDSGHDSGSHTQHTLTSPLDIKKKKKKRRYKPETDSASANTFFDLYSLHDDVLGEGALSSVHTCIEKASGEEFAVKMVHCISLEHRRRLLREIEILHLCQHQKHIVHLKEYFEAKDRFYVVFYKANGGPLLDHIRRRRFFSEEEVRGVMNEIVQGLVFLHHKGIAHRDLKPANILCENVDQVSPIRICDFDLGSNLYSTKSPSFTPQLGTPVGSCEFMAPEVIAAFSNQELTYDKKCDMWSLGVILYIMLSGRPPFGRGCGFESCTWDIGGNCHRCQDILIEAISRGNFDFPKEDWDGVSDTARDLIRKLLTQDPRDRLGAEEVLQHPWMTQEVPTTPLNTARNLNVHGTQTHAIPRLLAAYSVSNSICHHPISSNSPLPMDEPYHDSPILLPLRNVQSSPPSLYAQLEYAVASAFDPGHTTCSDEIHNAAMRSDRADYVAMRSVKMRTDDTEIFGLEI